MNQTKVLDMSQWSIQPPAKRRDEYEREVARLCGGKASKEEIDLINHLCRDLNSQWSPLGQKSRALSHLLRHSKAVPRDEAMYSGFRRSW